MRKHLLTELKIMNYRSWTLRITCYHLSWSKFATKASRSLCSIELLEILHWFLSFLNCQVSLNNHIHGSWDYNSMCKYFHITVIYYVCYLTGLFVLCLDFLLFFIILHSFLNFLVYYLFHIFILCMFIYLKL